MQKSLLFVIFFSALITQAQRTAKMVDGPAGKVGFYQYLPPGYQDQQKPGSPLIIFMHGIGEKGDGSENDLEKLNCCGITKYIDLGHTMEFTWEGKKEGFVVLAPQLASRFGTWQNYYIDVMLDYAKQHLNIDTNRIFLTGLSLGAGASWVYTSTSLENAKKIAGIVPVASPCFMGNGCNIANANLPVLAIHALDDDLAEPRCTLNAIKSITDCGAAAIPNLIMYDNGGHYVWKYRAYDTAYNYFNPNTYEWMLAQNRSFKPNIKPVAVVNKDTTISASSGTVFLDASASHDPDGKIVRYVWEKISGPPYGIMAHDVTPNPTVTGLKYPGVYKFRARVIDDRAEWSTATVKVTVVDGAVIN